MNTKMVPTITRISAIGVSRARVSTACMSTLFVGLAIISLGMSQCAVANQTGVAPILIQEKAKLSQKITALKEAIPERNNQQLWNLLTDKMNALNTMLSNVAQEANVEKQMAMKSKWLTYARRFCSQLNILKASLHQTKATPSASQADPTTFLASANWG